MNKMCFCFGLHGEDEFFVYTCNVFATGGVLKRGIKNEGFLLTVASSSSTFEIKT